MLQKAESSIAVALLLVMNRWREQGKLEMLGKCRKEIVTVTGAKPSADMCAAGLPEDVTTVLFKMDFPASAKTRSETLTRWKAEIGR